MNQIENRDEEETKFASCFGLWGTANLLPKQRVQLSLHTRFLFGFCVFF